MRPRPPRLKSRRRRHRTRRSSRARPAARGPKSVGQGLRKQGEPPGARADGVEPRSPASPGDTSAGADPAASAASPAAPDAADRRTTRSGRRPRCGWGSGPDHAEGAPSAAAIEPPPAPPELPPLEPPRTAAADPSKASPKPPAPVGRPIAEIKFGGDATSLTDADRRTLETVVPLYRESPGKVRIVGYAAAGSGSVEQLDRYRTALDRAQAVAAALSKAGIPSDKIQVEAAPASANSGESRAEVLLER